MKYDVEFYVAPNGECPTEDFLDELSPSNELPFVDRMIMKLEQYGHELRRPHVDILRDHIWELRVITNRQIRLLYCFFHRSKIIITHGFIKKSNEAPEIEIDRAIRYRADYFYRYKDQAK